jgi:cell wall-associated NlpC family hydrolase
MSEDIEPLPPGLAHFVATQISSAATKKPVAKENLASRIAEIALRTQISGASTLTVTLIDPEWALLTSGFLDVNKEGVLPEIEVQYPPGSGSFWRLCMVDASSDLYGPNVTLTFEDRIVSYLREKWGPKAVAPHTTTRAQFVKQLVDEVGRGDGLDAIKFVCPSINVVQRIEQTATNSSVVTPTPTASDTNRKHNKGRGLGHGAAVTVKGNALNASQIREANTLLDTADSLKAGDIATQALIFAAIGESGIGAEPGTFKPNAAGYYGVLQGSSSTWSDPHDTAGMARAFLLGGKGFQGGGAIALSRKTSDPVEIAVRVEVPSIWPQNAYAAEAGYPDFLPEAKAIIAAYGGVSAGSQVTALNAAIKAAKPKSDVSQLTRGTADNPDEDSWDCITRLAQEVQWFAFSNANHLYYMDGPDLAAQRPVAYITRFPDVEERWMLIDGYTGRKSADVVERIDLTVDNTSFVYRSTHVRKGKLRRAARIAKPSTPSEIRLNLVCPADYISAGDVIVFQQSGPANGRWIVTDATRNHLADTYTQVTLAPPTAPNPEPQATDTGAGKTSIPTGTPTGSDPTIKDPGKLAGVVQAAKKALAEKSKYVYSENADRGNKGTLFGPAPRTMDCSAFATLCYKAAGLSDPNHYGYSPIGWTNSFIAHCKKVANPQPGDVCFYGSSTSSTTHMTVYIGNGKCISMGQQGDPVELDAKYRGDFLGYYRSDVVT